MTDSATELTIRAVVTEALVALGVDPAVIVDAATVDELELDSLDLVDLTQSLRSSLSVVLSPRELDGQVTFRRLLDLVCKAAGVQ